MAVVVAQFAKRLLLIPEVRGSNPVIGKIYIEQLFYANFYAKICLFEVSAEFEFNNGCTNVDQKIPPPFESHCKDARFYIR